MMKTRQAIYKYRLCWLSKQTGVTGHGEPIFDTFTEAKEAAIKLNNELIVHWVEKVEAKEQPKEA